MKTLKKIFCIIGIMLILDGCKHTKHTQLSKKKYRKKIITHEVLSVPNKKQQYIIITKGIECSICAQLAVKALKKIPGVETAYYEKTGTQWKNGRIKLNWQSSKNLDQTIITQTLKTLGFTVQKFLCDIL